MNIIFTPDGYRVDGGAFTAAELYNAAFDNAVPDEPAQAHCRRAVWYRQQA